MGYEVVYGIRRSRQENILTRITRALFYRFLNFIAEIKIPIDAGDFRLIDRKVIDILKKF